MDLVNFLLLLLLYAGGTLAALRRFTGRSAFQTIMGQVNMLSNIWKELWLPSEVSAAFESRSWPIIHLMLGSHHDAWHIMR